MQKMATSEHALINAEQVISPTETDTGTALDHIKSCIISRI